MRQTALQSPPRHIFAAATAEIAKLLGEAHESCVVRQGLHDVRATEIGLHHGEHSIVRGTSRTRASPGSSYLVPPPR